MSTSANFFSNNPIQSNFKKIQSIYMTINDSKKTQEIYKEREPISFYYSYSSDSVLSTAQH